ncbi:MAG: hypothetical protein AB1782_20590, partial [Cyanobacteriota bacterium]
FNVDDELHRIIDFARNSEEYCLKRYTDFLSDSHQHKHFVSDTLNELYTLKDKPIEEGISFFKEVARHNQLKANSSVVVAGLSLLIFFKNIGSFEYSIKNSLELDIEIDIITPLVGAMAGSLHGIEKIPKHWKKLVSGRKDIIQKTEYLKTEEEKPVFKNYFIKEIELSDMQYRCKENAIERLETVINANSVTVNT